MPVQTHERKLLGLSDTGDGINPVGLKNPNKLRLFDMHGNVAEWCWDWYNSAYYEDCPTMNPRGAESGVYRVLRGGSWNDEAIDHKVASRENMMPGNSGSTNGFRIVRIAK